MDEDDYNFDIEQDLEPNTAEQNAPEQPEQQQEEIIPQGKVKNYRQTVCSFWVRGLCMKGDACGFLHQWDTSRMPVCKNLIRFGECKDIGCPYKHALEEIKECNMYQLGLCIYGPSCRFRHVKMPGPPPDPSTVDSAKPREFRDFHGTDREGEGEGRWGGRRERGGGGWGNRLEDSKRPALLESSAQQQQQQQQKPQDQQQQQPLGLPSTSGRQQQQGQEEPGEDYNLQQQQQQQYPGYANGQYQYGQYHPQQQQQQPEAYMGGGWGMGMHPGMMGMGMMPGQHPYGPPGMMGMYMGGGQQGTGYPPPPGRHGMGQ